MTSVRFDLNRPGLERQATPIIRRTHSSLTRKSATQARVDVPVDTGRLGRSIRELPQVIVGPFHVTGGIGAFTKYAAAVHQGSRPHVIRARPGKTLSFIWHGERVFFKSVRHPGSRARPFLLNAARRVIATDSRIT